MPKVQGLFATVDETHKEFCFPLCYVPKMAKKTTDVFLVHDDEYLEVLLPLLDHARKSIDILAYSFAIGSARGKIDFQGAAFALLKSWRS